MGIYLYSVRAKSIDVDGLKVHGLDFLCKPYFDYGVRMDRSSSMLAGKAEAYWAGKPKAEYVTLNYKGKFKEGSVVMAWDGRAVDFDEPRFEGEKAKLGFLKRSGKKGWTLAPERIDVAIGTLKDGILGSCLAIRTSGQFFTAEEAVAFAKSERREGETAQLTLSKITDGKCVQTPLAPTWYERLAG